MSLPAFGLVDIAGEQRLAGALEETEIGGVRFLKITPHGRHSVLVNPAHVVTINPCNEQQAKIIAARRAG